MSVRGLYVSAGRDAFKRGRLERYASGRGLDATIIEAGDTPSLLAALEDLEPGDVAILHDLGDLGSTPSAVQAETRKLLAKGVDVHAVSGVGEVGPGFKYLREAWSHGKQVEQDLEKEREARRAEAQEWASMFEAFQRTVGTRVVERFGTEALRGFDGLDIPQAVVERAPAPPANKRAQPDFALIGEFIKSERIARTLTQKQMAEQLGAFYQRQDKDARTPDVSAISRAESTGQGPHIRPLLELLAPDVLPGPELEAVFGDRWDVFASQRIKVRKARDAETFAAELAEYAERREQRELVHGANGRAPDNPFADATALQAQIGGAAANGLDMEAESRG